MGTRRNVAWVIRMGALGVALAGCGSSSSSGDGATYSTSEGGTYSATEGGTYSATEGGATALDTSQMPQLIIGSGYRFATPALVVPAGATVLIKNEDGVPHTVTSEAAPGAFSPSGAFDTGLIPAGRTATITIPAAVPGTVYYYYCSIHLNLMVPADGMITVGP